MQQSRTLHRALSMLLTAAMVLNMGLTPVFAAEGTPPGVSGICTHHTEHTEDCGYQQGAPCTHAHTDDCYTKELTCVLIEGDVSEIATDSEVDIDSDAVVDSGNVSAGVPHDHGEDCYAITENCKHTHDDTCGYTPDSPCTFDPASCTQCNTGDKPVEKVCTCPPVDSGELVHGTDCPLYTAPALSEAVQALIALVDALPNPDDIAEDSRETTLSDFEAAAEAYGALSEDDKAAFGETPQHTKLMALRDVLLGLNTLEITTHQVTSENELTEAINNAATGDTIQLAADFGFANNITFPAGKALVLDLKGKTLTGEDYKIITIETGAELTITDSDSGGTLTSENSHMDGFILNSGTINLNGGTVSLIKGDILVANSGTFKMSGGTLLFISEITGLAFIQNSNTGTFHYSSGTFLAPSGIENIIDNLGGKVIIADLDLEVAEGVTCVVRNRKSGGIVEINNSRIHRSDPDAISTLVVLLNTNGEATITNCTISVSSSKNSKAISNGLQGKTTITGGTISTSGSGSQVISNYGTATISACNITSSGGEDNAAITNRGTLEITGGKLSHTPLNATGNYGAIDNHGTLTIHSGVFTSTDVVISDASNIAITINDGIFVSTTQRYPALQEGIYTVHNGIIISGTDGKANVAALLNKVYGTTTLTESVNIPSGKTLTVPASARLTIAEGVTLSNGGTLDNLGTVTNNGTVKNRGTVKTAGSDGNGVWNGKAPIQADPNVTVGNTPNADYESIVNAWNEAGTPAVITLTSDISFRDTMSMSANASKNITLDLNGHTLEYTGVGDGFFISRGNTLTFKNGVYIVHDSNGYTPKAFVYLNEVAETITLKDCLILGDGSGDAAVADVWKVHGTATLYKSYTLKTDKTLTVPVGTTLTIPAGVTLTNAGTIDNRGTIVNNGTIISSGTLTGSGAISGGGTVQAVLAANMITLSSDSYVYTGSAFEPTVTVVSTPWTGAAPFVKDTDYTVGYTANTVAGTATVTVTPMGSKLTGSAVEKTFTITTANSALALTTNKVGNTVTYGDTITFTANVSIPATKARVAAVNTVDFYCDDTKLNGSTITLTESGGTGTATFTYNTTGKGIPIGGDIEITAKYGGSNNLNGVTQTVNVTLNQKPLTATVNTSHASATKVYDGNTNFTGVALTLTGLEAVDTGITATASGTAENANVGTSKAFTATRVTLTGTSKDCYTLAASAVSGNVEITTATPTVKVTAAAKPKSFLRSIIGDHNDTIVLTATTGGANGEKPNGSVVFKNGTTTLATKSVSNGVATCDWANPPAGNSITITAEFTASNTETNYTQTAVTGTAGAFDIDKGAQSALTVNVPVLTYGDTGKSLTTSGGSTGGTVTYNVTGDCVNVGTDGAITVVKAGTAKVTATMLGNSDYNDVTSVEATITVAPATPTISWGANSTQTVTYTGTAAVIPTPPIVTGIAAGDTSNGTITYQHKSTATKLTNLFGLLEGYTAGLPTNAGEYEVIATVAANGNYTAADSSEKMTLTITKSTPTLTINSGYSGKDYDGKAIDPPTAEQMTLSGAAYSDVTFTYYNDNGSNAKGDKIDAPKNAGTYHVEASIAETANTAAFTSDAVSFTINKIDPTITVETNKPSGDLGGKEITVTVKITNPTSAASGFPAAGEITITPTNATILGAIEGANGTYTATYTLGAYSAGAKAKFVATVPSETQNYNANTVGATAEVEILDKYTPTVTIAASKARVTYGESITLTATVGKNGNQSPLVGTVQFKRGEESLGDPVAINAEGKATLMVDKKILTGGIGATHLFAAVFIPENDSDYKTKTSETVRVAVDQAKMTGEVTITGTPKYGETLTPNTSALAGQSGDELGGFRYLWWRDDDTEISTESTYTIQEADIGKAITVSAIPTNKNYDSKESAAVTPTKADSTLTITGNPTKTYDGTAVSAPATNQTGNTGAVTFEWYSGGVKLDSAPKDAGIYFMYALLAETATHSSAKASRAFTITAKATTPTVTVTGRYTYTGSQIQPTVTVNVDGNIITDSNYTVSYGTNINAGTDAGSVAVTLKGNYSGSVNATFTIDKASGLNATTPNNILMIKGQERAYTFDLSTIALSKTDAGAKTYTLGALTNSNSIFKAIPSINGAEMTFTSNSIATPATNQATQVVTISTQNYVDTTVTLTFDITDKTPVTITGLTAATGLVYTGSAQNGYTGTAQFSPDWSGMLTYTYYEGTGTSGTKLSGAPTNAGTYTVVASIPDIDTSMAGTQTYHSTNQSQPHTGDRHCAEKRNNHTAQNG